MNEKEILYNMIAREVDNFLGQTAPSLKVFSNIVSRYVISYIDPYVDAFFMGTDKLNTTAAKAYINKEVNDKISSFISKFEAEKAKDMPDGL